MFGRFFKKKNRGIDQQPLLKESDRKDYKSTNEPWYIANIRNLIKQPYGQHVFKREVAMLQSIYKRIRWANEHYIISRHKKPRYTVIFTSTTIILPFVFWGLSKAYEAAYKNVSAAYQAFKSDETCSSYSADDYCPKGSEVSPSWPGLTSGLSGNPPNYNYCHGILEDYCNRLDAVIIFFILVCAIIGLFLEVWSGINAYINITTYINENEIELLKKYGIAIQEDSIIADFKNVLKQVITIIDGLKKTNIFKGVEDINNLIVKYCHSSDSEIKVETNTQPTITEEQNVLDFSSIILPAQSSLPPVDELLSEAGKLSEKLSILCGQKIRLGFANAKGDRIIIMGNESKLLDQDVITKIKNLVAVQGVTVSENQSSFWRNRNQQLEMNIANSIELSSCPIELLNEAAESRLNALARH